MKDKKRIKDRRRKLAEVINYSISDVRWQMKIQKKKNVEVGE